MEEKREFHVGDVLSVVTGRLVSPSGIGGIYKILNFMTGDNLFTHQLPRAMRECRPHLFKQFPTRLSSEDVEEAELCLDVMFKGIDDDDKDNALKYWLELCVEVFGETFLVEPIPRSAHEVVDPISELSDMLGA